MPFGRPKKENLRQAALAWVDLVCPRDEDLSVDDEEIEELKSYGFSEDEIDRYVEAWETLDDEDAPDWLDPDDPEGDCFPVLPENWNAAQIFLRAHLERQIDQGLTVYTGARVEEIRHWMQLTRIPPEERLETADSVVLMVRTACQALNERLADRYRAQTRRNR